MTTTEPLAPAPDLDPINAEITDALAELRGARADYQHSPNADSQCTVAYAEWRLDQLFERRSVATRVKV